MAHLTLPSTELLFDYFVFDNEICALRHAKRNYGVTVGAIAGSKDKKGYIRIKINGKLYLAHRLIYKMFNGVDPGDFEVDHVDRDNTNNHPSNLRLANHSQNKTNARTYRNNKQKLKGVSWHKQHRKYVATIQKDKKRMHIGLFLCKIEAAKAYDAAARKLFGDFAKTNF